MTVVIFQINLSTGDVEERKATEIQGEKDSNFLYIKTNADIYDVIMEAEKIESLANNYNHLIFELREQGYFCEQL